MSSISTTPETTRATRPRVKAPVPAPWWGKGTAPHQRWGEGVTIEIPAAWNAKRKRWESPDGRYYFDKESAARACDFFPTFLTHHIGKFAHQSFELMDYQKLLVVMPLFGWLNAKTGMRRFRFVFLFVPKGNGKSPLGSGVGLFLTLCDGEEGAEVYAMAGDKLQAKVVHGDAKIMVEESADLSERCEVTRDSIYCAETKSSYQVLSAEAPGKHGRRPHGVIIDELHNQKNRDLFEAFRKSMIKGDQPVMLMMSHAGSDDESICFEEFEYAKNVIKDPAYDESYLPVIFQATENDDWTSEAVHRRINPGYGITINPGIFQSECRAAQNEPRKKNDFLIYNANRWVNQATAWLPVEWWDACPSTLPSESFLHGLTACAGLDMAQKIDLASFVITFREPLEAPVELEVLVENSVGQVEKKTIPLNYRVHLLPRFWIPEETMLERARVDKVPYDIWAEQGLLTPTPGGMIDYERVYSDIVALAEQFPLLKQGQIGYDPAFATDISLKLRNKGLNLVEVPQNWRMSEAAQMFEGLVKNRRITHNGSRLMRWCMENVAVKTDDAGRIKPVKPRKATKRIDGVIASIMGISGLMTLPEVNDDILAVWI